MPGGRAKKLPAGNVVVALRSAASPIPILPAPEITVTTSGTGCVCGGTAYPAGNLSRRTNKPSLVGSPYKTAACAPAGSTFGPGPHFTSLGVAMCTSSAKATGAKPASATHTTAASDVTFMAQLPL